MLEDENRLTFALRRIFQVKNSDIEEIRDIEKEIYEFLKTDTNNINALIALQTTQIMQGNRYKAVSLAYKIWEEGGDFNQNIEELYINNLLDIGLYEMASVLLKPRFEKIEENIEDYVSIFLKFCVMTGNVYLLEKTSNFIKNEEDKTAVQEFIKIHTGMGYMGHFKEIQHLILEEVKEILCSYECFFFYEESLAGLIIKIYTDIGEEANNRKLKELNIKIEYYYMNNGLENAPDIDLSMENIKEKP